MVLSGVPGFGSPCLAYPVELEALVWCSEDVKGRARICLRRTAVDVMVRLAIGTMAVRRARATAERERNMLALWVVESAGGGGDLQV